MSKTVDLQVEKSQTLIDGLRRNLAQVADKGISGEGLDAMQRDLDTLREQGKECDALREELTRKVKTMNAQMMRVKERFAETKKAVKGYFPQEEWARFGVTDKR